MIDVKILGFALVATFAACLLAPPVLILVVRNRLPPGGSHRRSATDPRAKPAVHCRPCDCVAHSAGLFPDHNESPERYHRHKLEFSLVHCGDLFHAHRNPPAAGVRPCARPTGRDCTAAVAQRSQRRGVACRLLDFDCSRSRIQLRPDLLNQWRAYAKSRHTSNLDRRIEGQRRRSISKSLPTSLVPRSEGRRWGMASQLKKFLRLACRRSGVRRLLSREIWSDLVPSRAMPCHAGRNHPLGGLQFAVFGAHQGAVLTATRARQRSIIVF